jgi:hypothetical protein
MKTLRVLFACSLVMAIAMPAHAQLGGLKNKLKAKVTGTEKASDEKPAAKPDAKGNRYGQSALTATDIDDFIATWKKELEFYGLPQKEQDKILAVYNAREDAFRIRQDKWGDCSRTAVTEDEVLDITAKLQQELMEKSMSGADAKEITKLQVEFPKKYQKELQALSEKKCGLKPKDENVDPRPAYASLGMKEFFMAYLGARKDKGAAAAAEAVMATDEEAKLIEARLAVLQELQVKEGGKR